MSALQEVLNFLKENPVFYLATMDGNQPRVRPFGVSYEFEGRMYLITSNTKDVYHQLQANPQLELTTAASDGSHWLRLKGKAVFDDNQAAKDKAFALNPSLADIYQDPSNPTIATFYLTDVEYRLHSFSAYNFTAEPRYF